MDKKTIEKTPPDGFADLHSQNEMLKTQLINASMINELVKVLHSCTDIEGIVKTILLSFQDLVNFDRAILFNLNVAKFCLDPQNWIGFGDDEIKDISITLGFEGGDITDAIFLNRHIFVEYPDPVNDIFGLKLQSPSYIVVPFLRKPTRKCWELRKCKNKSCGNYGSINPYCWSNTDNHCWNNGETANGQGAGMPEDERRRQCLRCPAFKVDGIFWLDRKQSGKPIISDDISSLTNIITLAGLVLENFRMITALDVMNHDLVNANEKLRTVNRDLELAEAKIRMNLEQARAIQQKLLPLDIKNASEGYNICSRYFAANSVGGDYYDLFKIADGVYGIVVADVSGHGVASALVMSMVKVLLRTFSRDELSPQKTLERINEVFVSEIATEHFVTIFYAVFDVNVKKMRFASAGHCPVLFLDRKNNRCERLKADGLFLGVFPDMMLSEREYRYEPNAHRLVLYTDGFTEATNGDNDMYGLERLVRIATDTVNLGHEAALEAIIKDHTDFCDGVLPTDDITLLLIDFK